MAEEEIPLPTSEQEEPSLPFLVMGDLVQDYKFVDFEEDWKKVHCQRWEAYGCGEDGRHIVKGLTLFVRVGPEDSPDCRPSMAIRATPDVLSRIGWQIDEDMAEIFGRHVSLSATIKIVDRDVIVLVVYFHARHDCASFRSYCLVYDSTAAALFLLPLSTTDCWPVCHTPLKVGEGKYSLVFMGEKVIPSPLKCTDSVFLMWSPPSPGNRSKSTLDKKLDSTSAWTSKLRVRGNADTFRASVAFLCKGNAAWGDLAQGILYCDCSKLIDCGPGPVDVKCSMLPPECRDMDSVYQLPNSRYRTMGCVGDSIWFVSIDGISDSQFGQSMVKVWTLDFLSEKEEWKPHREFKVQDIWGMDDYKKFGLQPWLPKYPMLRQQDDGILYLVVPDLPMAGDTPLDDHAYLVGIDLSSSFDAMRLVVHRRMAVPWMDYFVFLDPDFFSRRHIAV